MTILGLNTETLNALFAGGGAGALLWVLRIVFLKFLGENHKLDIQSQLVQLAADSMDRTDKMLEAYNSNTEAIKEVGTVLGNVGKAFEELSESISKNVDPLTDSIKAIQKNV